MTKREIPSLVGSLQHATKIVHSGMTFVARMYATSTKVKEMDFYIRLNQEFCSDLYWWHTFLIEWNGFSLLQWGSPDTPPDVQIQTDTSGSWGCGTFYDGKWLQWQWLPEWSSIGIMAKKLVPIVLSCAVWGPLLAHCKTLVLCDNLSVVVTANKGSTKEERVMHLLCCLWFFVAHYDLDLVVKHIPGVANSIADDLSSNNMHSFFLQTHRPHCSQPGCHHPCY